MFHYFFFFCARLKQIFICIHCWQLKIGLAIHVITQFYNQEERNTDFKSEQNDFLYQHNFFYNIFQKLWSGINKLVASNVMLVIKCEWRITDASSRNLFFVEHKKDITFVWLGFVLCTTTFRVCCVLRYFDADKKWERICGTFKALPRMFDWDKDESWQMLKDLHIWVWRLFVAKETKYICVFLIELTCVERSEEGAPEMQ